MEIDDSLIINNNTNAKGFYNDINETQVQLLNEFKIKIKETKLIENIFIYNNRFYLRFLRARGFSIQNAYIMLENHLKWRNNEKVDSILSFDFPEIKELKKLYPHGYHKTDKYGRPIYIDTFGYIDVEKVFQITTEERWLRYYIREKELLLKHKFHACSLAKGHIIEQTLNIINLTGISLSMLTGRVRTVMQLQSKTGQDNYPEILWKVFVINTPYIFTLFWSLVKSFLSPGTVNKVSILGGNYKDVLLEYIDKKELPSIFGGECTCQTTEGGCLFSDAGPWNSK